MYWRQFYAWGELNELIDKCSTFVFFDLIRKCGAADKRLHTSDCRQGLQRSYADYRESNTTTETTSAILARAYMFAQSNKIESMLKHTMESVKRVR